ncbi:MAG: hypothetical protein A3F84_18120 [Candidatus Handelsmanbacteria bacterium RIFCSPLOWO2_12_FULL_64_10]|uniref:Mandelate racemase/muconate lactonizing enzyme C-terminal domain-containing protein n=1 Tax=Handelsmanbacteria sp. (strain RIFCSPLOWO2_12_FULL_64_10) TaxID=1817868 RepID=A0A1F6CC13_HANXR|nr:MAG: hypothetical protein A3F84_18120 [Candidatus Handelsmanbacteria bacterium RIFCSPLOWO2_12_FULL_64_10]
MKIAKIDQFRLRYRCQLVRITTDTGIEGWGETTLEGKLDSSWAAVKELEEYFLGKDPLMIEHHWQHVYRGAFFHGGPVLLTALSGVEQALYDIAGKHFGVPSYWLLGGPTRNRIKVYAHCGAGGDQEKLQARLDYLIKEKGYKAVKTGMPGKWHGVEPPERVKRVVADFYDLRARVGDGVDIGIDFHGRVTPSQAIRLAKELEGMHPLFIEEPACQENPDVMATIARATSIPVATGERLFTKWGFRDVLEKQSAAILQPDLSHAGGLLETKKIAAMAECYYAHLAPHSAIGPVAFAACLQLDACIPNFLIQEQVDGALGDGILKEDWRVEDGYIALPQRPGLGFEIQEEALKKHYEGNFDIASWFHDDDGSVADW